MRQRLIDLFYKPLLDPDRVDRTFRHFQRERGFHDYGARCRAQFDRQANTVRSADLLDLGFEHIPIMSPGRAQGLMEHIRSKCPRAGLKKNTPALQGFRVDAAAREMLLSAILDGPDVDARLTGFFGSEYLVHWMAVSETPPTPESATVSFRWHCDKGPPDHLKLIVYLNGTDEHGGNTEFINRDYTAGIARRGYVFGRTRQRTSDIGVLSRIAGRSVASCREPVAAGGGVVFQPAKVLHRGVLPTRASRYAVTLCLLPSPVPWREALERRVTADLAVDDKWPRHASELLTALEQRT